MLQADVGRPFSAHVIVLGNEKGGSGKSTTAMHVAVALLQAGQRVVTIDLDSRQKSFTHYIENRRDWAARSGIDLAVPVHFCVARGFGLRGYPRRLRFRWRSWSRLTSTRWAYACGASRATSHRPAVLTSVICSRSSESSRSPVSRYALRSSRAEPVVTNSSKEGSSSTGQTV